VTFADGERVAVGKDDLGLDSITKFNVTGHEVGVEVGEDAMGDGHAKLFGGFQVDVDVAARIDDDRRAGGFVRDEVGVLRQAVEIELLNLDGWSPLSCGYLVCVELRAAGKKADDNPNELENHEPGKYLDPEAKPDEPLPRGLEVALRLLLAAVGKRRIARFLARRWRLLSLLLFRIGGGWLVRLWRGLRREVHRWTEPGNGVPLLVAPEAVLTCPAWAGHGLPRVDPEYVLESLAELGFALNQRFRVSAVAVVIHWNHATRTTHYARKV